VCGGGLGVWSNINLGGAVITAAGAVNTPAYTTNGDTNTGIYFPAADTIAFTEGGAEAMRINSSGNVGIGTSSPLTALNVNGTGGELLRISVTSNAGVIQEPALGFATGVTNTHPAAKISALEFDASDSRASLLFYTRGSNADVAPTERMRIASSPATWGLGLLRRVQNLMLFLVETLLILKLPAVQQLAVILKFPAQQHTMRFSKIVQEQTLGLLELQTALLFNIIRLQTTA
jgi:hypothetical protein